jgi:serpin B
LVPTPGNLALPKFTLEYAQTLNEILKALGMEVAFDERRAEFARINPNEPLHISEVKHKSFVRLDEEGTEAAAATSVEIGTRSASVGFDMRVDRSFVIVLHDVHSQTVLFAGRVSRPQSE